MLGKRTENNDSKVYTALEAPEIEGVYPMDKAGRVVYRIWFNKKWHPLTFYTPYGAGLTLGDLIEIRSRRRWKIAWSIAVLLFILLCGLALAKGQETLPEYRKPFSNVFHSEESSSRTEILYTGWNQGDNLFKTTIYSSAIGGVKVYLFCADIKIVEAASLNSSTPDIILRIIDSKEKFQDFTMLRPINSNKSGETSTVCKHIAPPIAKVQLYSRGYTSHGDNYMKYNLTVSVKRNFEEFDPQNFDKPDSAYVTTYEVKDLWKSTVKISGAPSVSWVGECGVFGVTPINGKCSHYIEYYGDFKEFQCELELTNSDDYTHEVKCSWLPKEKK